MNNVLREIEDRMAGMWDKSYILLVEHCDTAAARLIAEVDRAGGHVVAVLAANSGTATFCVPVYVLGAGKRMSRAGFAQALDNPDENLTRWIGDTDPLCEATFVGTNFLELDALAGRPVVGSRPPAFARYEDKTIIDELFEVADVPRPESVVVDAAGLSQESIFPEADRGSGVVVALDSSSDFRGDGAGLRWEPSGALSDETLTWAKSNAQSVRISRFHEGVPCSVLGLVWHGHVATFSPIEIITLRYPAQRRLMFAGWSNHWRPSASFVERSRELADATGRLLSDRTQYNGFFSLDGIQTREGFLATEVNPRLASGLGINSWAPDFPIYLFSRSLQSDPDAFDWDLLSRFVESVNETNAEYPSFAAQLPANPMISSALGRTYQSRPVRAALSSAKELSGSRLLVHAVLALAHRSGHSGAEGYSERVS